jgi:hypothetical protein
MIFSDKKWYDAIAARFSDRSELDKRELYSQFFGSFPESDVLACLSLLEKEFKVPVGKFRPEDSLSKLFKPVSSLNPMKQAEFEVMAGDRQLEIQTELRKRLQHSSTCDSWVIVETIEDLVRAWCGEHPSNT